MRSLALFVLPLAAALAGCATNSAATLGSPALSMASLAESVEAPAADASDASAWHEVDPASAMAPSMSASTVPMFARPSATHLTAMVGERWLDEDEWGDFDNPVAYGLEVDGSNHDGHGYEVGVFYTNEDQDDLGNITGLDGETTTWDAYLGYRYTFNRDDDGLHPFVSVGGGAENGELEANTPFGSDSDDDTVFGAYARAGLLWDLGEHIRLGLDYRHFWGQDLEVNVAGADITANSDYDQVMATLGWGF